MIDLPSNSLEKMRTIADLQQWIADNNSRVLTESEICDLVMGLSNDILCRDGIIRQRCHNCGDRPVKRDENFCRKCLQSFAEEEETSIVL